MLRTYMVILLAFLTIESVTSQCLADGAYSKLGHALSPAESDHKTNVDLAQAIKDSKLSQDAQNITVVNENGSTVLRGFAKNEREKMAVANLAHQCGCVSVVNELKVRSTKNTKSSGTAKPVILNSYPNGYTHKFRNQQ